MNDLIFKYDKLTIENKKQIALCDKLTIENSNYELENMKLKNQNKILLNDKIINNTEVCDKQTL